MKSIALSLIRNFGRMWCRLSGAQLGKHCIVNGVPRITIKRKGRIIIGQHVTINSSTWSNPLNLPHPTRLFSGPGAAIHIGDHVGISSCQIVAKNKIVIGDGSLIGPGVLLYDSDGHSLPLDSDNPVKSAPIIIGCKVLIGARATILKGVTIGDGAVIGANSVVTSNVQAHSFVAGNPARSIRRA